jgi:hypothetical protein
MHRAQHSPAVAHVEPLAFCIVVMAVATAVIHLLLGLSLGPPSLQPFPLLFYLNTVGYLVLVAALYTPQLHAIQPVVRWVFIAYTFLTIVLWMVLTPHRTALGYLDKAIEVALVVLLLVDERRSRVHLGRR